MNIREQKAIVADVGAAAIETGAEAIADNLPVLAGVVRDAGLEGMASVLADGTLGAIAPRALGFVMNYKMNKAERNLSLLIGELSQNMAEINRRLDALEASKRDKFVGEHTKKRSLTRWLMKLKRAKSACASTRFLT